MRGLLQRLSAPPAQILQTLQPTPFTVSYAVSTRPVPKTVFAQVTSYVSLLTRIIVGLSTTLLIWTVSGFQTAATEYFLLSTLGRLRTDQLLVLAGTCEWKYVVPGALVILLLVFRRSHTEESLTVLRGLGIQTSTTSATYLQPPTTRFIPTTSIQDIFIYEAFKGFEVRFYLAIVVEGEEDVVVVFPNLLPKRAILEDVWRGTRKCLWEGKDEGRPQVNENNVKDEELR